MQTGSDHNALPFIALARRESDGVVVVVARSASPIVQRILRAHLTMRSEEFGEATIITQKSLEPDPLPRNSAP